MLKKRMPTEHEEQSAFVAWFRYKYPWILIFAIPNGGYRTKVEAAKLKREGMTAGIPDLYIPVLSLWIEFKRKNGRLSKSQKEVIKYLKSIGDNVIIAYGCEDAIKKIEDFLENP